MIERTPVDPKFPHIFKVDPELDPFPIVIISRRKDGRHPVFDRHTLAESCQTLEQALHYAERRRSEGYWVEIYQELAYATGEP